MQIIKNRQIVSTPWRLDPDETSVGDTNESKTEKIISLESWLQLQESNTSQENKIGVYLSPDQEVSEIAGDLEKIPVIALKFNSFTEGRGYSQAAELRQQYNYAGEIRALGATVDNLSLMERCGINAFQFHEDENLQEALGFFEEIETVYRYN